MLCFYHKIDLDGEASGAIVKSKYPECEMIGINYGDEFPFDRIQKDEVVYMVDFCLKPFNLMTQILDITSNFIWIDHHKTAIKDYNKQDIKIEGLRVDGTAACELTWQYIYGEPIPYCVELLGRYDIWNHTNPDVLPFQFGMKVFDTIPESKIWLQVFASDEEWYKEVMEKGKIISAYQEKANKRSVDDLIIEIEFEGLKCLAMNKLGGSKLFDSVWDGNKYDAMITFMRMSKEWKVSLYSNRKDIDVSTACVKYGGGGHAGAAGFECKELPFKV
jgi:uncharacterized protein